MATKTTKGRKKATKEETRATDLNTTKETVSEANDQVPENISEMIRKCVEEGMCDFGGKLNQEIAQEMETKLKDEINKTVAPVQESINMLIGRINELSESTAKQPTQEPQKTEEPAAGKAVSSEVEQRLSDFNKEMNKLKNMLKAIRLRNRAERARLDREPKQETKEQTEHIHKSIEEALACPECRENIAGQIKNAIHSSNFDELFRDLRKQPEEPEPEKEIEEEAPLEEAAGETPKTKAQEVEEIQDDKESIGSIEEPNKTNTYDYTKGRFYQLFLKKKAKE